MAKSEPPGSTPAWALAAVLLWLCLVCSETNQTVSHQALPQVKNPGGGVVCGKTGVSGKMFDGSEENVPEVKWPWQASLLYRNTYTCGAVLIDKAWVVTAANCLKKSIDPNDYRILIGYRKLQEPSSYSRLMKVIRIIIHNNFNKNSYLANDIALLQMQLSLSLNPHIFPACLPSSSLNVNIRSNCWITGWGTRSGQWNLVAPYEIQEARVAVFETKFCEINVHVPVTTTTIDYKLFLCVADLKHGNNICKGDNGGPLICSVQDTWYVLGISSWGIECNEPVGISYFTKVYDFVPWVNQIRSTIPMPPPESENEDAELQQSIIGPPMVNFTLNSQRSSQKAKTNTLILLMFLLLIL